MIEVDYEWRWAYRLLLRDIEQQQAHGIPMDKKRIGA
jgi:hypothetical protein